MWMIREVLSDNYKRGVDYSYQMSLSSKVLDIVESSKGLEDLKLWSLSLKTWSCENVKVHLVSCLGFFPNLCKRNTYKY